MGFIIALARTVVDDIDVGYANVDGLAETVPVGVDTSDKKWLTKTHLSYPPVVPLEFASRRYLS